MEKPGIATRPEQTDRLPRAAKVSLGRRMINYFLTGLVITGPIGITLWLAWWVISWVDNIVVPLIPARYNPDTYLPFQLPGLGVVVAISVVTLIGFLTANLVGRWLLGIGEMILSRMPIISSVYNGLKQIFEAVINPGSNGFKKVGLIEFPRKGTWSVVLIASDAKGEVAVKTPSDDMVSVFVPTTPNPTSGFLVFVSRADIVPLDMSIEDAAKLIISSGLIAPEYGAVDKIVPAANVKRKVRVRSSGAN